MLGSCFKQDDVVVALNNQFYTFGETKLTQEPRILKRIIKKPYLQF